MTGKLRHRERTHCRRGVKFVVSETSTPPSQPVDSYIVGGEEEEEEGDRVKMFSLSDFA